MTGALSYTEVEYHDRLDAVGFANDARHRIAALGIATDERDSWLGRGASALQLQYLYGRVLLDTAEVAEFDSGPGGLRRGEKVRRLARFPSPVFRIGMGASSRPFR